jgi:hypothetical protein
MEATNHACDRIEDSAEHAMDEEREMKIVGRLTRWFWNGLILTGILGTIAAVVAKQRIVRIEEPEADEVRLAAIFEPISFRSTAKSFRGGTVDCWYGGGVIDLRGVTLDPAGARLEVRAIFGGGQIVVPETWHVTSKVVGIGGLGDGRPAIERPADAPHLTIEGLAIFGGFGVSSEISEGELRGLDQAVAARRAGRAAFMRAATPEVVPAS